LGDFNADGKLDVVESDTTSDTVWLGNGDGTLSKAGSFDGGYGFVVTADFNQDSRLDLAISDGLDLVNVLLGNGDGTFQPAGSYTLTQPAALITFDMNGDRNTDLAVLGGRGNLSVLLGNVDGTFQSPISFVAGAPSVLAVADFNRDNAPDIVIGGAIYAIATFLNTGGATVTTTSSANPSHLGQSVTFTTTVAPTFAFIGTPTGTITFKDGTTTLGKVTLTAGQASLTTSALTLGKHKVTAIYSGDPNFNPNQAAALRQRVIR
jgi:hypothetical protein